MASCWGCKFLYSAGEGYSNYTWEDTIIDCARSANTALPKSEPYDWIRDLVSDNWPATNEGRCSLYAYGPYVALDVDGEVLPEDETDDPEAIQAISDHCGRDFQYERDRRKDRKDAE